MVFFILLLSKLQQRSWRGDTPFFPKTLTFLHSDASTYEDTLYMNFTISLDKLKHEIFQTCVYPLMGGNNYINYSDNLGHWLSFSAPSILQLIFAFVAFLVYYILLLEL